MEGRGHIREYLVSYDTRVRLKQADQPFNLAVVSLDEDPELTFLSNLPGTPVDEVPVGAGRRVVFVRPSTDSSSTSGKWSNEVKRRLAGSEIGPVWGHGNTAARWRWRASATRLLTVDGTGWSWTGHWERSPWPRPRARSAMQASIPMRLTASCPAPGPTGDRWSPRPYLAPPYDSEDGLTLVTAEWLLAPGRADPGAADGQPAGPHRARY